MRYVFVDDSALAYDGYTPLRRPLGGMEKAVIGLTNALFERGHDVKVINRVAYAHMAEGAYWVPFGDAMVPKQTDVLIALRKPQLMGFMRAASHRLLWVMGAPDYLNASVHEPLWDSFGASLLFIGQNQRNAYKGKVRNTVIAPGVRPTYWEPPAPPSHGPPVPDDYSYNPDGEAARQALEEAARKAAEEAANAPPALPGAHAIVTTHPSQGLLWLVDVWSRLIHPQMPNARLSVYSAVLSKGIKGEEVPETMLPILEQVMTAVKSNVVILDPRNDEGMAQSYREARVHLYPGDAGDFACWTLGESQAAGVPAVARALGGTSERIDNGSTGYIVPDDSAFANVTLQILGNDDVYKTLSAAASEVTRRRPWALAAQELENFIATLPPPD